MSRKPDDVQLNVTNVTIGLEACFIFLFFLLRWLIVSQEKGSHLLFRNYFYKILMILAMVNARAQEQSMYCTCQAQREDISIG